MHQIVPLIEELQKQKQQQQLYLKNPKPNGVAHFQEVCGEIFALQVAQMFLWFLKDFDQTLCNHLGTSLGRIRAGF